MSEQIHSTPPLAILRGAYAIRFDQMLDELYEAVCRHPRKAGDDAELRRRLHGILKGIIAFSLNAEPHPDAVATLGEPLYSLSDGSREALADIHLTLLDLLTGDLTEIWPPLRQVVANVLVHVSYGFLLKNQSPFGETTAPVFPLTIDDPFRQALTQMPRGFFMIDAPSGEAILHNDGMVSLFGRTQEEDRQVRPEDVITDETPEDDFDLLADLFAGRIPYIERESVRRHKDGHPVRFHMLAWPVRNEAGDIAYLAHIITSLESATRQLTVEQRTHFLSRLPFASIFIIDPEGSIDYASPSVERMLGYDPDHLAGTQISDLIDARDLAASAQLVRDVARAPRKSGKAEVRLIRADGETGWFEIVASNLLDVDVVNGIAVQARDISERKVMERQLEDLANIDSLTNVLNRRGFLHALDTALATMDGDRQRIRLVYTDVDNFKDINDRHGHIVGDAILTQIATRLTSIVQGHGAVGRIGGDEFVILLQGSDVSELERLERDIGAALSHPYDFEGEHVVISGSIGLAEASSSASTSVDLLRAADRALYERKASRSNPT